MSDNVTPLRPANRGTRPEQLPLEISRAVEERRAEEALIVDIDGYEGPLDLLLNLARVQKVDLMQVSILQLAEQYLAFVEEARQLRIELAADYLVMSAWLAFLKSRLLLPPDPEEEGPSAEDLAAHLAFQLERLDAMRQASSRLMGRDRLGQSRFVRGSRVWISISANWLSSNWLGTITSAIGMRRFNKFSAIPGATIQPLSGAPITGSQT